MNRTKDQNDESNQKDLTNLKADIESELNLESKNEPELQSDPTSEPQKESEIAPEVEQILKNDHKNDDEKEKLLIKNFVITKYYELLYKPQHRNILKIIIYSWFLIPMRPFIIKMTIEHFKHQDSLYKDKMTQYKNLHNDTDDAILISELVEMTENSIDSFKNMIKGHSKYYQYIQSNSY